MQGRLCGEEVGEQRDRARRHDGAASGLGKVDHRLDTMLKLKRIYEPATPADGERFLVERLWARGVTKEAARLAGWLKDLAPSPALRQWYGHDPERWPEFRKRYEAELRAPEKAVLLRLLVDKAREGVVTLVFAARDPERNSAVVLQRYVEKALAKGVRRRRPPGRSRHA